MLSNLPKATQLVSGRARLQTQAAGVRIQGPNHHESGLQNHSVVETKVL